MALVEKGRLLLGLPYQGKLYFEVEAHVLTIRDECEVLEVLADLGDNEKNTDMLIELAYLAAHLRIEGIPPSVLTPHYLLENLSTDDYTLLLELIGQVRKKRIDAGESQSLHQTAGDASA